MKIKSGTGTITKPAHDHPESTGPGRREGPGPWPPSPPVSPIAYIYASRRSVWQHSCNCRACCRQPGGGVPIGFPLVGRSLHSQKVIGVIGQTPSLRFSPSPQGHQSPNQTDEAETGPISGCGGEESEEKADKRHRHHYMNHRKLELELLRPQSRFKIQVVGEILERQQAMSRVDLAFLHLPGR